MITNLKIRKITGRDVPVLAKMTAEIQQLHHQAEPDLFASVPDDLSEFRAHVVSYMARGTGYIAEVDGQAVGCVLYEVRRVAKNLFLQPHVRLHIDQMGVRPVFQGRGVGRELMEQVISAAREHNAHYITLNVYRFNDQAIRFYEKFGFECRNMTMQRVM